MRQTGSHKVFLHPDKADYIIVPGHPGDLKPGIERDIRRKAGW